ncbi:MAG: hypothetical protein ACJAYB_000207 [Psychromonas sp.]|jgi:hypothetical protein
MLDNRFDNIPLLLATTHPDICSQEIQQLKKDQNLPQINSYLSDR